MLFDYDIVCESLSRLGANHEEFTHRDHDGNMKMPVYRSARHPRPLRKGNTQGNLHGVSTAKRIAIESLEHAKSTMGTNLEDGEDRMAAG